MIVQIYEIQDPREAETLLDAGVDHLGAVILDSASWKSPAILEVMDLLRPTTVKSCLIPLFQDPILLRRLLDYYEPDILHLCDLLPGMAPTEHPESTAPAAPVMANALTVQRTLKEAYPALRIMRTLPLPPTRIPPMRLAATFLASMITAFTPWTDFFLLDTVLPASTGGINRDKGDQPVAGFVGITGETCDWDLAATVAAESERQVILAGGLSPENVAEAIRRVHPAGVDSCSRTNRIDDAGRPIRFRKDPQKVRRFVLEARQAALTPQNRI